MILDMNTYTLSRGSKSLRLTRMQAEVLRDMAQSGRAVSHREIAALGEWSGASDPAVASRQCVSEIRRAVRAAGMPDLIATTRGKGYWLLLSLDLRGVDPGVTIPAELVPLLRQMAAHFVGKTRMVAYNRQDAARALAVLS